MNLPFKMKSIISQLRLFNNYNSRLISEDKIIKFNTVNFCYDCYEVNSFFHMVISCNKYLNTRRNNFSKQCEIDEPYNYFIKLVSDHSEYQILKLTKYILELLKEL